MGWIISIAIAGYILYSFFSSKEKMKQQVDNQGGMKEKYSIFWQKVYLLKTKKL